MIDNIKAFFMDKLMYVWDEIQQFAIENQEPLVNFGIGIFVVVMAMLIVNEN